MLKASFHHKSFTLQHYSTTSCLLLKSTSSFGVSWSVRHTDPETSLEWDMYSFLWGVMAIQRFSSHKQIVSKQLLARHKAYKNVVTEILLVWGILSLGGEAQVCKILFLYDIQGLRYSLSNFATLNGLYSATIWPIKVIFGSVTSLKVPDVCTKCENFWPNGRVFILSE